MKDKFNNDLMVGDPVVYAVRQGSCSVALNYGIVSKVAEETCTVQPPKGKKVTLHFPERIALLHRD